MHSYPEGASEALLAITKEYVLPPAETNRNGVNLLGALPLDFGNPETLGSIRRWLNEKGFSVIACLAMGDSLDTIAHAGNAAVNLVLSYSGLSAAEYLYDRFGIPYVCGVPVGGMFSEKLCHALRRAAESGQPGSPCIYRGDSGRYIAVIGENITGGSIAAQLGFMGYAAHLVCPLPHSDKLLMQGDADVYAEGDLEALLAEMQPCAVIADPLYRFILPKTAKHIELPHYAFSGRCFERQMQNLTGSRFDAWLSQNGGF